MQGWDLGRWGEVAGEEPAQERWVTDVPVLPRKSYLRKKHIKVFWHHFPLQRRDDITSVDVSGKKICSNFYTLKDS